MNARKRKIDECQRTIYTNVSEIFQLIFGPQVGDGMEKLHDAIRKHIGEHILHSVQDKMYGQYIQELINQRRIDEFLEKICEDYEKNEQVQEWKRNAIGALNGIKNLEVSGKDLEELETSTEDTDDNPSSNSPTFNQVIGAGMIVFGSILGVIGIREELK